MLIKIFFSYARADKKLLKKLKKHLRPLQWLQLIDTWYDGDIAAGENRQHEVNLHLNAAQIILLLISPDFMDSDNCYSIEMKRALERHTQEEAYVIPVILKPVYWQIAPFANLQHLPKGSKPIVRWKDKDTAFLKVAEGILKVIQQLLLKKSLEYCRLERYQEALRTIEQALSAGRNYTAALSSKGYVLSDNEDNSLENYKVELVSTLDKAFRHIYQDYSGWYIKGKLLHDLGRDEEACKAYDQAIRLGKNDIDIHRDRAITLCNLKKYKEALIAFNKALHFNPEDVWILTQKGITMRDLKRAEEALAVHDEAIRLSFSKNAWVITEKAITLRSFKRFDDALVEHERAKEANPNDAWAMAQKAITLRDAQRWEESLDAHEKAIELNEYDAWLFVEKAITLRDAQRWEKSIEAHKKAIKLNEKDGWLHFELGKTLLRMANTYDRERYEEAIASFDEAIRLKPYDAGYVTWKAIALRDSSL